MLIRYGCSSNNPDRIWEVTLPDVPKPPVVEVPEPDPKAPKLKVLHMSDTHYDPYYSPGSNAACPEKYLCCREESGPVLNPEDAAGYWGDYRYCDAPKHLLELTFDFIAENHPDIDFIIWTGDLVPHAIWNTSREENLDIIRETVYMIRDKFPGIPVYPAAGNHESHPVNAYPQPYIDNQFDISWLYDELASLWQTWLPEEAVTSIAYSATYTMTIKDKLKLISLNSNYGYSINWWLLYDSRDPAEELDWLAKELQKSEDAGELVYLISHMPSGHYDCHPTWSHQYNRIITRYESTIAGIFSGHSHKDYFQLFFDPDDQQRVTKVSYVGQGQTPYHLLNPGYKIYTIDGEYNGTTYTVLDHENWILDLDEANESDDPKFKKLYSAKDAFGMPNLRPESWLELVYVMSEPGSPEFDDFFTYYTKDARPYKEEGCDEDCKFEILCRVLVSDNSDHSVCDYIRKRLHS